MLWHLPLAFRPLGAEPGDAGATLPAADIALGANVPTIAAGSSATMPAADTTLGGAAPELFEGMMVTLPTGAIALGATVPTAAAGASAWLAQTIEVGGRYGVLGELPLGGAPLDPVTAYLPKVIELSGTPLAPAAGVAVTLAHTRSIGGRYGLLGELPLGAAPLDPETTTGPADIHLAGRAPDAFARRRRPAVHAIAA